MRNRPQISWDAANDSGDGALNSTVHESPTLRLWFLFFVLMFPVTVVGVRLAYLQTHLGSEYVAAWETTTIREEVLPCRDGRILSADGQVLAEDRWRFDVKVHYRWLENPPDDAWLKQRALSTLPRQMRRDAEQVASAKAAVLAERRRLWDLLAETTGRSRTALDQQRAAIQQRVERIVRYVTSRRDDRLAETMPESPSGAVDRLTTLNATPEDLQQIGEAIVGELTTPPRRLTAEPIIVAEELSHHVVVRDVGLRVVAEIESAPSMFPGVRIQARNERVYPAKDLAAHVVGVRTDVTPEDLNTGGGPAGPESDLHSGDRVGRIGIERAFDRTLRGRHGRLRIVTDRHGEILSQTIVDQPLHGQDVVLTIDAQLQRAAEELLEEAIAPTAAAAESGQSSMLPGNAPQGGCLIAMDVRTGDVITAAAAPRFDLGLLLHPDPQDWQRATADPRRPFYPRCTQMTIPPGSVFKILTSIALLESRLLDPDQPYHCQGFLDRPDRNRCYIYRHYGIGHGDMTLSDAICQSCNVYFFHAARALGPQPIVEWAARFGLGVPTGGEVPGEKGGHLPKADGAGRIADEQWYNGSTLQLAIGQATLTVTPLQVARMVAAIANDGYLVTPRFVQPEPSGRQSASTSPIELAAFSSTAGDVPVRKIPGLSPETLARVRDGMRLVVDHQKGTGRRVRRDDVAIAGKTGTAEVGGRQGDHAWFVGYVPADAPRYAFVVVLEHGGSGGSVAAPVAQQFIEAMLEMGVLTPSNPDGR